MIYQLIKPALKPTTGNPFEQKCLTTGTLVLTAWFDNIYINVVRVSVRGLTKKPHGIFRP